MLVLMFIQGSWTAKVLSFLNLLILVDVIRNIITAMVKKKKGAWIIGAGFLLFIFFFVMVAILGLTSNKEIITTTGSLLGIVILSTFVPGIISIPLSMSIYLARDFAGTNKNLEKQLENVKVLSAKTIEQEREKQRILENQKEKLEVMVDERTKELALEKEKTEELLLNTLPLKVVNELKENGKSEPESFENVTVYFSDIVGFTDISSKLEPKVLIGELSEMFTIFDDIMTKYSCERIKTIGDAYLAVSGMPLKNENHAENMMNAAMEIKQYLNERNKTTEVKWRIRIGIHSGKVVGGIVGVRKYIYDVFGDTINTASRMESNSEPMLINVSEATYSILKEKFEFIERETIEVKGKGCMKMYFLEG
jgi:class 3 adenylate cyclase